MKIYFKCGLHVELEKGLEEYREDVLIEHAEDCEVAGCEVATEAEAVRAVALQSLDLSEDLLGTAVLKVEKSEDGDWDLLYADSSGTFEGLATFDSTGAINAWWDQGEFED